jgi:hypothetical protein
MISCVANLAPQSIMTVLVAMQQQKYRSRGSRCSRQQAAEKSRQQESARS